ncbi:MAG: hypothetical protein HUJ51_03750 [Eggerthellaceae bacterium]|nr:hypothetical protein [Eggerthellaceae bacterium]
MLIVYHGLGIILSCSIALNSFAFRMNNLLGWSYMAQMDQAVSSLVNHADLQDTVSQIRAYKYFNAKNYRNYGLINHFIVLVYYNSVYNHNADNFITVFALTKAQQNFGYCILDEQRTMDILFNVSSLIEQSSNMMNLSHCIKAQNNASLVYYIALDDPPKIFSCASEISTGNFYSKNLVKRQLAMLNTAVLDGGCLVDSSFYEKHSNMLLTEIMVVPFADRALGNLNYHAVQKSDVMISIWGNIVLVNILGVKCI